MLQSSIDYESKYEYKSGDPHLKPQKQHSFNLSGNYKSGYRSWPTTIMYSTCT